MTTKISVAGIVAAIAAACVFLLQPRAGLAVAIGVAILGFAMYVLRERAALRGLYATLRAQSAAVAELARTLDAQNVALDSQSADAGRLRQAVGRLDGMGTELARLHAVATTQVLDQVNDIRQQVDGRLATQLTGLGESIGAIERRLESSELRISHAATQTEVRRLHTESLLAAARDFRQVEALAGLHALFSLRAPLPASRKWAASPDLMYYLTSLVLDRKPSLVVELGGGLSTIWLAYAMEKSGHGGRIISVDHDPLFAEKTRSLLAVHGLSHLAEVRVGQLTDVKLDGEAWPWYDQTALSDVRDCDLLIVDGPPAATRKHARFPALPLLVDAMAEHALVVVDDCIREDEQEIVARWSTQFGDWSVQTIDHEKVTKVLSR